MAESERDVDATVVPLSGGRRFVVRRADGLSIYATRDLGAIALRRTLFKPSDIVYIVGQEQQTHFTDLFEAAVEMGLVRPNEIKFRHVYFGFYVDAATGKKLSSRNSVSSVNLLLSASVDYFRQRTALRGDMTQEEIELAAHQLSIGSVVFNDLKQDVRGSVDIHTEAIDATVAEFEKSGGAYLVYTACRARAILRKFGGTVPHSDEISDGVLSDLEAKLLLKIQQVPEIVVSGASDQNPTLLIRHLLDLATLYNSYYVKARVIENGAANPARLLITAAVASSLVSALKMCHVECPDKI